MKNWLHSPAGQAVSGLLLSILLLVTPAAAYDYSSSDSGTMEDPWPQGWDGHIFGGLNQTSGNTDKGSASLEAEAIKKVELNEYTLRGNIFYSSSNNKMDGQKWDALARLAREFEKYDRWYSFYQIMVDHDYFADIDYRITPSTGLGYHFSRTEDWTWNADAGLAYEITRYRINTASDDENVSLLLHTFAKKKVLKNAFLSEDLTVLPGLESGAGVRVKSISAFINPLNESLDLELRYIVDYDSEPAAGKSTTDKQLVAGITYKF